jgi:hypothetical protein
MAYLTHRYVGSDLRFLTLNVHGVLDEISLSGKSYGDGINTITNKWDLTGTGALSNFQGLWFNAETNRLWVTSSGDYTNVFVPAHVTMMTLNDNGSVSNVKHVNIGAIPEKRVYGGCQRIPAAYRASLGGEYVCGWGGYTSLVGQAGGASMGPTMYAIPDPETFAAGGTMTVRTLLDTSGNNRGLRATIPLNYFDGGDRDASGNLRLNPTTPPTLPPSPLGSWLSPNAQGLGWFVWGDSYYNNGMWISTPTKQGFVMIAALGTGKCWYMNSTLHFDGRTQELHIWDPAKLANGPLTRPDSMSELVIPGRVIGSWEGNVPQRNISGATFDPYSSRMYLVSYPDGPSIYTGRLYVYQVNG